MATMQLLAECLREKVINRQPRRLRPRRRELRPMAEGLEMRSLLSVGLDPTFGNGGAANLGVPSTPTTPLYFSAEKTALQVGQVVAGGYEYNGTSGTLAVARLTTAGTLDTSFGTNGVQTISPSLIPGWTLDDSVNAIAVQSNSQILLLTTATSSDVTDLAVIRLNPNGGLDTNFGNNSGIELFNFGTASWAVNDADALAISPTGTIIVVGTVTSSTAPMAQEFGVASLTVNGALNTSFNAAGATPGTQEVAFNSGAGVGNATPVGVAVNAFGGIAVVGNVTPTTAPTLPVSNIAVALLNSSGVVTGSRTLPALNANNDDTATAIALEGSQILIAGYSVAQFAPATSSTSNVDQLTVTRLNPDGTTDTTFNGTGTYALPLSLGGLSYSTRANAITVMSDGTLLVGGNAAPDWLYPRTGMLVNLTPMGSLNQNYGTNGVALLPVPLDGSLEVQLDGKVDFVSNHGVDRTTPPLPLLSPSPILVTRGIGNRTQVVAITIPFNTAVNGFLASNPLIYRVRVGPRGGTFIRVRRALYNASDNSVTLVFRRPVRLSRRGYQVIIRPSTGIVAIGAGVLNNGARFAIYVPATATS